MNISTILRRRVVAGIGIAAGSLALAAPFGTASAAPSGPGPIEHGVIEVQCEAHGGSFFVNTFDGTNLICSGVDFRAAAMPAHMACERMGGEFRTIGSPDPLSWACGIPAAG